MLIKLSVREVLNMKKLLTLLLVFTFFISINAHANDNYKRANINLNDWIIEENGSKQINVSTNVTRGIILSGTDTDNSFSIRYNKQVNAIDFTLKFDILEDTSSKGFFIVLYSIGNTENLYFQFLRRVNQYYDVHIYVGKEFDLDLNTPLATISNIPLSKNDVNGFENVVGFKIEESYYVLAKDNILNLKINGKFLRLYRTEELERIATILRETALFTIGFKFESETLDNKVSINIKSIVNTLFYDYLILPAPEPPTDEYITYTTITFFWEHPENFKDLNVGGYIVERFRAGSNVPEAIYRIVSPDRTSHTDKKLDQGVTYTYIVKAVDSVTNDVEKIIYEYAPVSIQTKPPIIDKYLIGLFGILVSLTVMALIYIYWFDIKKKIININKK